MKKQMEYQEAIDCGFELYDEIESEIRSFKNFGDAYAQVEYVDDILKIDVEWRRKICMAKIQIKRDEIFRKVIDENIKPKDAICKLLREKVCMSAYEE